MTRWSERYESRLWKTRTLSSSTQAPSVGSKPNNKEVWHNAILQSRFRRLRMVLVRKSP
jgi:hypothetical protein